MKGLTEQVQPCRTLDIRLEPLLRNLPRQVVPRVPPRPANARLVVRRRESEDDDKPRPSTAKEGDKVGADDGKDDDARVVPPLTVVGVREEVGKDRACADF